MDFHLMAHTLIGNRARLEECRIFPAGVFAKVGTIAGTRKMLENQGACCPILSSFEKNFETKNVHGGLEGPERCKGPLLMHSANHEGRTDRSAHQRARRLGSPSMKKFSRGGSQLESKPTA
jgi:hypothetical protein